MRIPELKFSKLWTNRDDFPTVETREEVVRSDMQLLFNEIRDWLNNTLTPAVKTTSDEIEALEGDSGAQKVGFVATEAVNKTNVQDAIEEVQRQVVSAAQGSLASGAVTTDKLADKAVTADKIADGAVTYHQIADGTIGNTELANNAVQAAKIATNAVQERHIFAGSVSTEKIAAEAVTSAKLATSAVTSNKIAMGAVTKDKIATGAVTKEKIDMESLVTHVGYSSDGAAGRTINVGGNGILLFIYGNSKYGFVFPWGSVYAAYGTATWQWQDKADIIYENGVLTFVTANAWANEAGHTFVYQML